MYYTIYKTTNIINGKFYIGKHKAKNLNDGYLGSGKLLKRAIKKYGVENFHKEILHICKDENHMNLLEKILVVPDDETNYNICDGGKGGWSYVNRIISNEVRQLDKNRQVFFKKLKDDVQFRTAYVETCKKAAIKSAPKISAALKQKFENGAANGFKDKSHNDNTKLRIAKGGSKRIGNNNGSYGTCWITNSLENKKIKKEELANWLELGYKQGRTISVSSSGKA